MDNAVFGSECGLVKIRVPVINSVTDDLVFGGCIHYIMALLVVEGRAYDVTIPVTEIPRSECVGLVVYEDTEAGTTNWGGNVVKRDIEVFPG